MQGVQRKGTVLLPPIIRVSAGLIQFVYGSHSRFATGEGTGTPY